MLDTAISVIYNADYANSPTPLINSLQSAPVAPGLCLFNMISQRWLAK